jgi:hypothetical protein
MSVLEQQMPGATHSEVGGLVIDEVAAGNGDGCREAYRAPAAVVVPPGHVGWVEGDEAAVLVQYDCGPETIDVLGLPVEHRHDV